MGIISDCLRWGSSSRGGGWGEEAVPMLGPDREEDSESDTEQIFNTQVVLGDNGEDTRNFVNVTIDS